MGQNNIAVLGRGVQALRAAERRRDSAVGRINELVNELPDLVRFASPLTVEWLNSNMSKGARGDLGGADE